MNNFCVDKRVCELGMYRDESSNECKWCDIKCLECFGPLPENCLKCANSRPYLQQNECVAHCGNGFYLNETAGRCFP